MADERIVLSYDPGDAIAAADKANKAIEANEKSAERAGAAIVKATEENVKSQVVLVERGQREISRLVQQAERKAAISSSSPTELRMMEKERLLRSVSGSQEAANRITAAYDKIEVAARKADEAAKLQGAITASKLAAKGADDFAAALRRVQLEAQKEKDAIEATVRALERRSAVAGKTSGQRLAMEAAQAIGGLGAKATQDQINRVTAAYDKLAVAQEKAAAGGSKLAEFIRNPLQAAGGAIEEIAAGLGKVGAIALSAGAGIAFIAKAGFDLVASQGRAAEAITNFADTVGISATEAYKLDIQAKLVGSSLESLTAGYKKLSQGIAEGSDEGKKSATALDKMGVRIFDLTGKVRPFGDLFGDIAKKIQAIEEPSVRAAKGVDIFGKSGLSLIPLLLQFQETRAMAEKAADGINDPLLKSLADADDQIGALSAKWETMKNILAGKIVAVIEFVTVDKSKDTPGSFQDFLKSQTTEERIKRFALENRQREFGSTTPIGESVNRAEGAEANRKAKAAEGAALIARFRAQQGQTDTGLKERLADVTDQRKAAEQFGPGMGAAEVQKRIDLAAKLRAEEQGLTAQIKAREEVEQKAHAAKQQREKDLQTAYKLLSQRAAGGFKIEPLKEFEVKPASEVYEHQFKAAQKLSDDTLEMELQNIKEQFSQEEILAQSSRDKQMAQAEGFHARTVQQKIAVEEKKAEIEREYQLKSFAIKAQALQVDQELELAKAEQSAELKDAINQKYAIAGRELTLKAEAAIRLAGDEAASKSAVVIQDQVQKNFDSVKHAAEGLFDTLILRTKSWGDFLKNAILLPALTLFKQIASTAVASALTGGRGGGSTSGIGGLLGGLLGGSGIARAGAPGGTGGFAGPVGGLSGMLGIGGGGGGGISGGFGGAGGAFGGGMGAVGLGGLSSLALGGAGLGLFGAFKAGQSDNKVLKGIAPVIGAVSGLVGFGALASMFPALIAAGPAGWIAAAGIGAAIGIYAAFKKRGEDKLVEKIKSVYGITIDRSFARNPLMGIIKDQFGGDIDTGIRSPMVKELLAVYRMQSNQAGAGSGLAAMNNIARGVSLSGAGGAVYQNPVSVFGTSYGYGGSIASSGPSQPFQQDQRPIVIENRIQIDGRDVQASVQRTNQASNGRRESAAVLTDPLLIFG